MPRCTRRWLGRPASLVPSSRIAPLRVGSTPISANEAYWIRTQGNSRYQGRMHLVLDQGESLAFDAAFDEMRFVLRNLSGVNGSFQIERLGGRFVLAALAVPEERFDEVTALVNALPEVAHNYRREHRLNMWFVLATETPAGIAQAIARIEAATGLPVFAFPKLQEFFVDMRLKA